MEDTGAHESRKKAKLDARLERLRKELAEAKQERDAKETKLDMLRSELARLVRLPEGHAEMALVESTRAALLGSQGALDNAEKHYGRLLEQMDKLQSGSLPPSPSSSTGSSSSGGRKSPLPPFIVELTCVGPTLEEVERFWRMLPQAQLDGNVLRLAEGTTFLGRRDLQSTVYIRSHYERILEIVKKLAKSELEGQVIPIRRTVLLGTPGIGKTFFLYWLLWKLRLQNVPLVIVHAQEETYKLTSDGAVEVAANAYAFRDEFKSDDCWYLADGVKPFFDCNGMTVLATSPNRDLWYNLWKQRLVHLLYMPLFDLDEMLECQRACFPHIPGGEEGVRERFEKYGGMARAALEKAATGDKAQMELYEFAANGLDDEFPRQLLRLEGVSDRLTAVHRVVHMEVTDLETYSAYQFKLATPYQAQKIYERFWQHKTQDAIDFVTSARSLPMLGQIRGVVFELAAHHLLSQGGEFRVRNLHTGEESKWVFPKREVKQFHSIDEISGLLRDDKYARPVKSNLESVDSIVPDMMLQMAARDEHPVKAAGLNELERVIDPPPSILVFVVPTDKYDEFKAQKYTGPASAMVEGLEQYVLEIPLYH